jgi:transketolase
MSSWTATPAPVPPDIAAAVAEARSRYPLKAIRQQYGETLLALAELHPQLIVLTADLMHATGMDAFGRRHPDRLVNVGIAEQNMTGIAAGLSLCGRPVVVDGYAAFTTLRAVEQAKVDAAYNATRVILTGQSAGLSYGVGGPTHQTFEDVAIMRAIPNMIVVAPSDAAEVDQCLRAVLALDAPAPVYVRLGRGPEHDYSAPGEPFVVGSAKRVRPGDDLAIVANGPMVFEAAIASDQLARRGIGARVINLHTVKPIDRGALAAAAREVGAMIVVEEHNVMGGLGGAVVEALSEVPHGPIRLLGIPDIFPPIGPVFALRAALGLCAENIVVQALDLLARIGARPAA